MQTPESAKTVGKSKIGRNNLGVPSNYLFLFSESAWNLLLPYSFNKILWIHFCVPNIHYSHNILRLIVKINKFEAAIVLCQALAKDIPGYLAKATYLGWRPVAEGKHSESAYFSYFSRELGCRTILCMRRLADGDIYKPYAIINDHTFAVAEKELRK